MAEKNNMTPKELKKIISQGEGTTIEFQSSQERLAHIRGGMDIIKMTYN